MIRSIGAIAMLLCLTMATGCDSHESKVPAGAQTKSSLVIAQVRADRTAFDPAKQEAVTIRFNLNEPADVILGVYDGRDHQVYRQQAKHFDAGDRSVSWNGMDEQGHPVPPEAYAYTLTAENGHGETLHDLTDLTGGDLLTVKDVRWDAEAGVVRYTLDRPARVNLRLGLQDGPYLRTLIDWVPRGAGPHEEHWDGKDASGVLALGSNPAVTPVVKAYALPDNTLFVGTPSDRLQFVAERTAPVLRERNAPRQAKQMFDNAQQPLETRGDLVAILGLDGKYPQDKDGRWIVSGKVPFTANVPEADRQRVLQRRFEAVFYVDGVFTHENELGYLPLTWTWDASQVNPGEHFITLNIRGYEGNFGASTLKVVVEPKPAVVTSTNSTPKQEHP